MTDYKKKLIEVALPLDAINKESAREKSIRHGHPSTLHLWWARRPLAACRAVLFAQLVDDPSSHPDKFPTEDNQYRERNRLFGIIEELVRWENINNEVVLTKARQEILKSTDDNLPTVLDPFCGGGSIPLEAQRLGLKAYASDLNPVAVLITKALIEIPSKFANRPPIHPGTQQSISWKGAKGLAEDVKFYGEWMRDEAKKRIGYLYPKVKLPKEQGGGEATAIAWIWTRTVKCPNPACGAEMPLASSFWLSKKKSNLAWLEPKINKEGKKITYKIKTENGKPQDPPKIGRGAKFRCLFCKQVSEDKYIKNEGMEHRAGAQLMAIVTKGKKGRVYIEPNLEQENIARSTKPTWFPEENLPYEPRAIWCTLYGLKKYGDLFTPRQLVALTTFSDLVMEAKQKIKKDAVVAGLADDGVGISENGTGADSYSEAIMTYLSLALSRAADAWSSLVSWRHGVEATRGTFARQGLPMVWDFAEANPFSNSCGNWNDACIKWIIKAIELLPAQVGATVAQQDARSSAFSNDNLLFSTDPPYYDNIGYADLSDFFYIWLRKAAIDIYPDIFSTMLVPKTQELIANPYRFDGNKEKSKNFFENGLKEVFKNVNEHGNENYPVSIYYAFKQTESKAPTEKDGPNIVVSTGWETMLESLMSANFQITGTWPIRTERSGRSVSIGTNALASSIVLVCRRRDIDSQLTTRRDFLNILRKELPINIRHMQRGNIAPVDLAQSSIGPGMAIFSQYKKVLEADGTKMSVRSALALINQVLDEYLAEQEGEYDAESRWALAWFEQHGMEEGPFGVAETLSKAKNTAIDGLVKARILEAKAGKVRLLKRKELPDNWDPGQAKRITIWELSQHLIKALIDEGSEEASAELLGKIGALGETARDLAYRLYTICDRKKWSQEALAYNSLVVAWPELVKLASQKEATVPIQQDLF
jgi:putative DNA methylase